MLYAIPFISAAIGWITNYVAIKMLFYPREPRKVLFMTFQGIFPKRKVALAQRLAKLVADELLSTDQLKEEIDHQATHGEIKEAIEGEVEAYLREKVAGLNPILSTLINESRLQQLKKAICGEIEKMIPRITYQFFRRLDTVNIEKLVFEKVSTFTSEKLENMMMSVIQKELKFIEWAGAVLGFLIGLMQVFMLIYFEGYP